MRMRWMGVLATSSGLNTAQDAERPFLEFMRDPTLTIACVLLVVVSVGWVVVTRIIVRRMKRAAIRGVRSVSTDAIRPAKDIWTIPP